MPHPVFEVTDSAIEDKIFELLATRKEDATICPSDVARALDMASGQWRGLMPRVRHVAKGLAERGRLRVTRGGVEVDAESRGGPIRLGRPIKRDGD
jgi:hypothetical protein